MRENQWTEKVRDLLREYNLGENIYVDVLRKVPYANEVLSYNDEFEIKDSKSTQFETDLLVFEQADGEIRPRVIIEAKIKRVTTHDAIAYSYKALNHKNVTPYLRYGIMLGKREDYPLPGRLFRHGSNFDFMISFKDFKLVDEEINVFVELLKKEIEYSQQLEEMIYQSRSKERKRYFVLQKELRLEEM